MASPDVGPLSWQLFAALIAVLSVALLAHRRSDPLHSIPTIGPSAPILSWLGAFRYVHDTEGMLREGYKKFYGTIFKISMLDGWLLVFTGPKLIDELRRSPDDELSSMEGSTQVLQLRHTLGPGIDDQFHVAVVRDKLTRNLAAVFPDILDEVQAAFLEYIPAKADEWTAVKVWPVVQTIVARASNRVIVGMPKCRDEQYLDVAIKFTNDVFVSSFIINLFPDFLKPLIARALPMVARNKKVLTPMVVPMLMERQRLMDAHGVDWEGKPRDMLQWLLEEARVKGTAFDNVVEKVLLINFGAIHTSSGAFTHALYNLAAYPQYMEPLRDEVDSIVAKEGWSKASIGRMRKLDSFLKESMRLADGSLLNIFRKAMKDITLSDGTRIPKGTLVAAAAITAHSDDTRYADPAVFDPFRFSRMREGGGLEDATRHQLVNTSVDFITFGGGKHACPGRFFAANELKTMMAHLVLNYDVRFAEEGKRPANVRFGPADLPSHHAEVLFRRRQLGGRVVV